MFNFYISGDTFDLKEEIKTLKPSRKDFRSWWKFLKDTKCWHLSVQDSMISKKFLDMIIEFCEENDLELDVVHDTGLRPLEEDITAAKQLKNRSKSISDFETLEGFFAYLHGWGQRRNKDYRK